MRKAQFVGAVETVKRFRALARKFAAVDHRLTAAAGAAAGAGHDFHKVVTDFAGFQSPHQPSGVAKTADNSTAEGEAAAE